jgi:hypothetical protein
MDACRLGGRRLAKNGYVFVSCRVRDRRPDSDDFRQAAARDLIEPRLAARAALQVLKELAELGLVQLFIQQEYQ